MKPWLFNILAAMSLVLSVGSMALWIRSRSISDDVAYGVPMEKAWVLRSYAGVIYIERHSCWMDAGGWSWRRRSVAGSVSFDHRNPETSLHFFNFGTSSQTGYHWEQSYPGESPPPHNPPDPRWVRDRYSAIFFPHWVLALILAAVPFRWYLVARQEQRRRTRRSHGLCMDCGYNLTGNVSGVCPECGTIIQPAAGGGQQAGKGATT